MKNQEISGAMPGLKYDVGAAVDEVDAMIDRLASTPAGHPAASELSQKIKSSLGRIRAAVDNVQPDDEGGAGDFGGPQNGGRVVGDGGNPANLADQNAGSQVGEHEGRLVKLEDRMTMLEEKFETLHADLGGGPEPALHHEEEHHDHDPPPAERQVAG